MPFFNIFQSEPFTSHFPESGLTPWQVSTELTISDPCNITADGLGLREIEKTDSFRRRQKHDFLELTWSPCSMGSSCVSYTHVCVFFWHAVWTSGHEPVTFGGATLFLEAPLHFKESVEFHGNLSVIAVRQPLKGPCVYLRKDGIVQPGAALRFANCHNQKGSGGAMEVDGNLFIHGDVHIRNCSAAVVGGSLDWNWSQTAWKEFTKAALMYAYVRHWVVR